MSDVAKTKAMTKAQLRAKIAEDTALAPASVAAVLDSLTNIALQQLKDVGSFSIPDLVKLKTAIKPATVERVGIDPFTKLEKTFKAKPASTKVKATILKAVKDAVATPIA